MGMEFDNLFVISYKIGCLQRLRFLRLKDVYMLKLSDHDGLKNPEEMNPSSQSPIPSKEGQDRKCHCHNVPSCVWEKGWKRQLEEKLSVIFSFFPSTLIRIDESNPINIIKLYTLLFIFPFQMLLLSRSTKDCYYKTEKYK